MKIKNILKSIRNDVKKGRMTIRQATLELYYSGWMNFASENKTKELLKL